MIEAKQKLADLMAERAERTEQVQTAERKRADAATRLSRMRAQQALDGVDHSKRIAQAERDIADCSAVLAVWPDVQAELQRRTTEAETAVKAEKAAALLAELADNRAGEAARRLAFAEALLTFSKAALECRNALKRKVSIKDELLRLGSYPDIGDTADPDWGWRAVGEPGGVAFAEQLVAKSKGEQWAI